MVLLNNPTFSRVLVEHEMIIANSRWLSSILDPMHTRGIIHVMQNHAKAITINKDEKDRLGKRITNALSFKAIDQNRQILKVSWSHLEENRVLPLTRRFISIIVINIRKKPTKTKEASGNGLSGLPVDVLFLPIVLIKALLKSISPTVITITLINARPRL